MGISYSLYSEINSQPREFLLKFFQNEIDDLEDSMIETYIDGVAFEKENIHAFAGPVQYSLECVPEFGIIPVLRLKFSLARYDADDPPIAPILFRAVINWLKSNPQDNVILLHDNGDTTLLVKHKNGLILQRDNSYWHQPEYLAMIDLSYTLEQFECT